MTEWEPTTIRLKPETRDALDEISSEWDCSVSELIRQQCRSVVADNSEELPESIRIGFKRETIKNESSPDKYRGYFRANAHTQAQRAWERGCSAKEGQITLQSYLDEFEMLFETNPDEHRFNERRIRQWLEGLVELFATCRLSDGWGQDDMRAYHNCYPDHIDVLDRAWKAAERPPIADNITGWEPQKRGRDNPGEQMVAECPDCGTVNMVRGGDRFCQDCGGELPV